MTSKTFSRLHLLIPIVILAILSSSNRTAVAERIPKAPTKELFTSTTLVVEDLTGSLTPDNLANTLVGQGVTITNVSYTGANVSAGTFTGGENIVGFNTGIILSSGSVTNVVGPNQYDNVTTVTYGGEDPDLSQLSGFSTYDAAVLEFDFIPNEDIVSFQFVFASDEYNEYVNSQYNDVFGFFVNGTNCAVIAGDPISINTINNGNPFDTTPHSNPELYINNDLDDNGGTFDTEMDGLTKVLTCSSSVIPNQINHIKLAIADASDDWYDSAVFIHAQSITTERRPVVLLPGLGGSINYECFFLGIYCDNEDKWDWMPTGESYYKPLIDRLADEQYTPANGYFNVFHYDWTEPLVSNIFRLKQRIAQVKMEIGEAEVDLIGHSMGGLLARAYVQNDSYAGDVAHLVTLGSPHRGAAKAYPYWEAGHLYQVDADGIWKVGLNILISYFKIKDKTLLTMTVIQEEAPGVKDILPTETYLYDEGNSPIPENQMEHRNTYLGTLNQSLDTLYGRTSLATFVSEDVPSTAYQYLVRDRHFWEWPRWDDGVPIWDHESEFLTDKGDGTVPTSSAVLDDPRVDVRSFSGVVHSQMAGNNEVINGIFSFLNISSAPPPVEIVPLSALMFVVNGPTDITVMDPLGRHVTTGVHAVSEARSLTEIPNADYVSFPNDPFKMIVIPDPQEGNYTIQLNGSGTGAYSLGSFDSNQTAPNIVEEWDELWDILETETEEGAFNTFTVSYSHDNSDTTQLVAVTPIVEKPLYWGSNIVSGRALPGNLVTIHDADSDAILGNGSVDTNGIFSVLVSTPLQLGQRISAKSDGLTSVPVTVEAYHTIYISIVKTSE